MNSIIDLILDTLGYLKEAFVNFLVLFCVPSLAIFLCVFFFGPSKEEHEKYTKTIYEAWCKLHYRQDLSLEEWKILRSHNLLTTKNTGTAEKY